MEFYKYIIILIYYCTTSILASDIKCERFHESNCICSPIQGYYESQCPMDIPEISMRVFPDKKAYVQCDSNIDWNSSATPYIRVGNALAVHFRVCSFANTTFMSILNKIGINSTKQLKIDYSSAFNNITSDYFDRLEDLEMFELFNSPVENIEDTAFSKLRNLNVLRLGATDILLTARSFKTLSNLTVLEISRNDLRSLPHGIFDNLINLKYLNLWANNLSSLDGDTFRNLKNLQSLELLNNQLRELPEDILHYLHNLKNVSLAFNKFQSIPQNLFNKNKNLYLINLSRNEFLSFIPNNLFSNLTKLGHVYLNSCNLSRLPEYLFDGSANLQKILLQDNKIEKIGIETFDNLTKLQYLDLSNNRLADLPDEIFSSLTNLKTLNLENNMLKIINDRIFNKLYELEELNLRKNRISYVDYSAFQTMSELKIVILSHNFVNFPDTYMDTSPFNTNVKIEKADLSYNNITTIHDDWTISKVHLEELNLSFNNLKSVEFRSMMAVSRKLKLDLSHNKISQVDFRLAEVVSTSQGRLDAVTSNDPSNVVIMNDNPMACDCFLYDFVRYFERDIDPTVPTLVTVLADDLVCASPSNFVGFPVKQLKTNMLTCDYRQLHENFSCPDKCECRIRLWDRAFIINCINRNMTSMPKIIMPKSNIVNQTIVYLQRNLLKEGPRPNMGYENVTKLYLSSNNINEITWLPPKIEVLNLDNNNISSISDDIISMLNVSSLSNISLGNNPWKCDCLAANLTNYLVSHLTNKQIDANHIKCRVSGKLMVHLSTNDLCPSYTALVLGTSITITLIMLALAIFAAMYYRYEQEIKIWLFAHNMCLWFVTEEEVDKDKLFDAFISYSHKDEDFVLNDLVSVLEQGPQPYKLCLHIRDWIAGEFIPKQIARSVEESRRTVVVLSKNFLQSVWGKMEFRTAHTQAMAEGRARVIVILYGDINVDTDLDEELKAYIKTNTYVKWGDPWFWDKLRYALPHSRVKITKRAHKNQNIMISLNDKLDLITAIPSTPNSGSTPPAINVDPLLLKNNPLDFRTNGTLTPPAESGLNPLLTTIKQ